MSFGSWLIVASAAGAPRNPAWYYNLAANADKVQIEMAPSKIAVTAEQLHGAERDEAWQQITAAVPRFAKYQQKRTRGLALRERRQSQLPTWAITCSRRTRRGSSTTGRAGSAGSPGASPPTSPGVRAR